jgi:hypothetical protein
VARGDQGEDLGRQAIGFWSLRGLPPKTFTASFRHRDARANALPNHAQKRALLQGIISCGRCARHMYLRYSGPNGDFRSRSVSPSVAPKADRSVRKCEHWRSMRKLSDLFRRRSRHTV